MATAFRRRGAGKDIFSCPSAEAPADGNEMRAGDERERPAGPHGRERYAGPQRTETWLGGADERERERARAHLPLPAGPIERLRGHGKCRYRDRGVPRILLRAGLLPASVAKAGSKPASHEGGPRWLSRSSLPIPHPFPLPSVARLATFPFPSGARPQAFPFPSVVVRPTWCPTASGSMPTVSLSSSSSSLPRSAQAGGWARCATSSIAQASRSSSTKTSRAKPETS
jgi:hypothetical protein